jgi:hypothetical protein
MKHLNEYANDFLSNDTPFAFESYYDSVFKKVDIYNKNTRLINEGKYNSLPTHIPYSTYEQAAISEMLFGLQFKYLYNALSDVCQSEINEGISDIADKMKDALSKGKETFTNYIKELVDKIPSNIKEAYDKLGEIAERGISNAKEFLNKILKVFKLIGDNLNEVLNKLGLFKDDVVSEIPDTDVSNDVLSAICNESGNKEKVIKFLVSEVHKGVNNKSVVKDFSLNNDEEVNEGIGKIAAIGGAAGGLLVAPGPTLLVLGTIVGSILLYKGTVGLGKFLSKKLEPYLLSDKVKSTIEKMYNNKIIRYGLGLKVSDKSNEELSGFKKMLKFIHSILINMVIASLITTALSICVGFLLGAASNPITISIIVGAIVAGKNIFATIANRILNFKKETTTKDGKKVTNYFFDFMTMFSIFSSIFTFLLKIPAVKEWISGMFEKLANLNLRGVDAKAETINDRIITRGYIDSNGNFIKLGDCQTITIADNGDTIMTDIQTHEIFRMDQAGRIIEMNYNDIAKTYPEMLPDGLALFKDTPSVLENVKSWSKPISIFKHNGDKISILNGTILQNIKENTEYLMAFATTNDGKMHAVITVKDTYVDFANNVSQSLNPKEYIWKLSDRMVDEFFDAFKPTGDGIQTFTYAEHSANIGKKTLINMLIDTIKSERGN